MPSDYDASMIQVLEGLEAVRVRPGMYIGSTKQQGLHHLVYEVVDNSIEEALAGHCQNIDISINADGSITIVDDGRGIPTEIYEQTDKSTLEMALTNFHVSSLSSNTYSIVTSMYGLGIAVVTALSAQLEVKVWQNQNVYTQRFERGIVVSELEIIPSQEDRTGTSVTFLPDPEIFQETTEFDLVTIANRCKELAYLHARIRISLTDYRLKLLGTDKPKLEIYCYAGGLRDYVIDINADKQPIHSDVIHTHSEKDQVRVEVALQWCIESSDDNQVISFANMFPTVQGGKHVEGLNMAVTHTINAIARKRGKLQADDENLEGDLIRYGLTAIVAVMLPYPEFAGCVKHKLANPEVRGIVDSIVSEALTAYLISHPHVADAIIDRAVQAAKTTELAKRERE
jgi:DNA gyrase subunit B